MANSISDIQKSCAAAAESASAFNTVSSPTNYFTSKANSTRIKEAYTRGDYNTYREDEARPKGHRDLMQFGNDAYHNVAIVYNIVNLMSDFVVKGMEWQHTNRNVEAFMNSWWREVKGYETSQKYVSYLLRMGNSVIYPVLSKIKQDLAKEWKKTRGEEFSKIDYKTGYVPSSYNFISPLSVSQLTGEFGSFIGKRVFTVTLSQGISSTLNKASVGRLDSRLQDFINTVPASLREKITNGRGQMTFTEEELMVDHYKKDDWELWGRPMIACVFPQLITLEKMHLADMSALDGAISNIRLWNVGFIDPSNVLNSIIPTPEMLEKIRDLIHNNVSGGVLDLIWGPELTFKESNTNVHNFLGPEKYTQVMQEIYDGLGVPPSLSGGNSSGGGGGFTNNFIAMKVLIERLNYLRVKLVDFWCGEAKKIQKAMGFSSPAKLRFSDAVLSDEDQHKKILLDMWDRDIIDTETIRKEFNFSDKVVQSRLNKEYRKREKFKSPPKASPFHDPMVLEKTKMEMIKSGQTSDEDLPFDVEDPPKPDSFNPKKPEGRPFGKNDEQKRKQKVVRPRTTAFVNIQNWARGAYDEISEIVNPSYLEQKGKASIRALTREECDKLEDFKLTILINHTPLAHISEASVLEACADLKNAKVGITIRDSLIKEMMNQYDRQPTIEDKRVASCAAYAMIKVEGMQE